MHALMQRLSALEVILIGVCVALALAIELLLMVTRYLVLGPSLGWLEQVAIYCIVWALWLSGSQLVEKHGHIHNDLLLQRLSRKWQRLIGLAGSVLGLLFSSLLCYGSWVVVHFAQVIGETTEGDVAIPLTFYYLSMAIGTLLVSGKYLLVMIEQWRDKA